MIKISKHSMRFTGQDANNFLVAISSDEQLLEFKESKAISPGMREAVMAELIKRDLLEGNWQI